MVTGKKTSVLLSVVPNIVTIPGDVDSVLKLLSLAEKSLHDLGYLDIEWVSKPKSS